MKHNHTKQLTIKYQEKLTSIGYRQPTYSYSNFKKAELSCAYFKVNKDGWMSVEVLITNAVWSAYSQKR